MALSRFWSWMLISSICFVFYLMGTGKLYTLNVLVNGKQNDPVLQKEMAFVASNYDTAFVHAIQSNENKQVISNDTIYQLSSKQTLEVYYGKQAADGMFTTCKNTMTDLWLPLIGYLTFFCGLLNLLKDAKAIDKIAVKLAPFFERIFPELPKKHEAFGYMTMNFAANFLGLDNAATPFGLKAMESMQEVNPIKDKASNSQIMFLCLHAAGLTLIPTSIIGYRAAQHATNPADIMVPTIVTSFIGTLAALLFVSIKQKINLLNWVVISAVSLVAGMIVLLMVYIQQLLGIEKIHFTGNLSNLVLLGIVLMIVAYAVFHEKIFSANNSNVFDSFIEGAKEGFTTGVRVLPYMIAMLVALSIFRNSSLMDLFMGGLTKFMYALNVDPQIVQSIPVALMRPFSAGGARGFMLDAMKTYGPDSLTGQLACLFQGAAETTFYVVALYFGSVKVKDARYTLGIMLLVDLVCVLAGIGVCKIYF